MAAITILTHFMRCITPSNAVSLKEPNCPLLTISLNWPLSMLGVDRHGRSPVTPVENKVTLLTTATEELDNLPNSRDRWDNNRHRALTCVCKGQRKEATTMVASPSLSQGCNTFQQLGYFLTTSLWLTWLFCNSRLLKNIRESTTHMNI